MVFLVPVQGGLLVSVQGGLLVLDSDIKFQYSYIFTSENTGGLFVPFARWSFLVPVQGGLSILDSDMKFL